MRLAKRSTCSPEKPCVSTKSGHVFEASVIEKYVESTGKWPVTGASSPFEAELLQLIPQLAGVKPGSCPWWFSARTSFEGVCDWSWKRVTYAMVEAWGQATPRDPGPVGNPPAPAVAG